jgi:4-hydroxy-tetrahydrodipicolinate synthase
MRNLSFEGVWTALVTPMLPEGDVDTLSIDQLVDYQLQSGVHGLVACGTTGEAPTLSHAERNQILEQVLGRVEGHIPVLMGVGTNDTPTTLKNAKEALALGAQGIMIVAPYYNRPTPEGLYRHFATVAEAVDCPILLYNNPIRCGIEISIECVQKLHTSYPHVRGIKDCNSHPNRLMQLAEKVGEHFSLLTGDDNWLLPALSLGAKGIVGVLTNVCPNPFVDIIQAFKNQDIKTAQSIYKTIFPLIQKSFIETNPIAIKYLLFRMGLITADSVRLPLTPLSLHLRESVEQTLREYQFLA